MKKMIKVIKMVAIFFISYAVGRKIGHYIAERIDKKYACNVIKTSDCTDLITIEQ